MGGRARRKAAPRRVLRPSQVVKAARQVKQPVRGAEGLLRDVVGGPFALTPSRGLKLSAAEAGWMYECVRADLGALYDASAMKWDADEKRDEISHPDQQHVLVADDAGRCAFLSYRFDVEAGAPVMYVYEVFVAARVRRRGIAAALMRVAEHIARAAKIPKIMLTTFVSNKAALRLYREKLGYQIDGTSPSNFSREGDPAPTYEILSLTIPRVE